MSEIEIHTASRRALDVSVCLFLLAFGTVFGLSLALFVETGAFAYGEYHASNGSAILMQLYMPRFEECFLAPTISLPCSF